MEHIIEYDPQLPADVPTPCYVVDTDRLQDNLKALADVQSQSGCKILAALKGFAMHSVFPLMREHLAGICASGPHEARLGAEEFGKEVHVFAPAFSEEDLAEILPLAHHISFNSFAQWKRHRQAVAASPRQPSCGLRVNPEYSEVEFELYNPCAAGSRLGIRRQAFQGEDLDGIEGLHFHTMCEQNSDTLERTLVHFEEKFGEFLPRMKWVNFGGGHHITSPTYDRTLLVRLLTAFRERHPHLAVYLEPGEAIAINTGVLVARVLDIQPQPSGPSNAILDISATCHMPDVLEMPYRPVIRGAAHPGEKPHAYRLGGLSCLAGDVIGDFAFDQPLQQGDRLLFMDMAHYTMVKTTTFNGIKHPHIATWSPSRQEFAIVRRYGYQDYKSRLS